MNQIHLPDEVQDHLRQIRADELKAGVDPSPEDVARTLAWNRWRKSQSNDDLAYMLDLINKRVKPETDLSELLHEAAFRLRKIP